MIVTYEHKPVMTFMGFSTSVHPEEDYKSDIRIRSATLTKIMYSRRFFLVNWEDNCKGRGDTPCKRS